MDKSLSKPGPKPNPVLENRIRLNAGKIPACELAWLMGMNYDTLKSRAAWMKVSLRVKKDKP
jgi:hypothetical protein